MAMWPTMTAKRPIAIQSCTKVAPVRQLSENGPNHFMIEPVASITGTAPATKAALSFWPGLNFPSRTPRSRPSERNQRRSSPSHRLSARMSRRRPRLHGPIRARMKGTGSSSPKTTWTSFTRARRPTMVESGPT